MSAFTSVARRSRYVPLELALPGLAALLMAAALVAIGWISYVEVRRVVLQTARSRVEYLAEAVAATLERDAASTLSRLHDLAADSSLTPYLLSGGARAEFEARAVLGRLAAETDSLAPAVILSRDGSPVLTAAAVPEAGAGDGAGDELSAVAVGAPAEGGFGPVFWKDGRPSSWATAPILSAHEQIGWLAQLYRLDNRDLGVAQVVWGGGAALERLAQNSSVAALHVRLASTPGDLWSTLEGEPVPAPTAWPFAGAGEYRDAAGELHLAHAAEIGGTAWFVVAGVPAGEILADARRFLRRTAGVAAGMVLSAALAAWLLGRGLARSIRRLGSAAHAIAAGDRASPVVLRGGGELSVLAAALNDAAARSHGRRRELEVQHGEVRELAAELVRENEALEEALAAEKAARLRMEENSATLDR